MYHCLHVDILHSLLAFSLIPVLDTFILQMGRLEVYRIDLKVSPCHLRSKIVVKCLTSLLSFAEYSHAPPNVHDTFCEIGHNVIWTLCEHCII